MEVINMFKSVLVLLLSIPLLLALQGEGTYDVTFAGENLSPIEEISLCANDHSVYLAYAPPDSSDAVVVQLNPQLEELRSTRINGIMSPCIKAFDNTLYLAGINSKEESIVIHVFSDALEPLEDFHIAVEEPVDVYILPYQGGILLSYVHRFLEEGLLRQDVFLKKLDTSFAEVATTRLTDWYYWENPCLAICGDTIVISYSFTSLTPFMNRYLVVAALNSDLEKIEEIRYPIEMDLGPDNPLGRNAVQPDMTPLNSKILLLFRMTDLDFSKKKFTLDGIVTVMPGNIKALQLTDELQIEKEAAITSDYREQFEPTAVTAFGHIYLAYYARDGENYNLQIIYADSLEELKIEPPAQWQSYWPYILGIVVVAAVVGLVANRRLSPKKDQKKSGKDRKKKER
jgi:hypothetical protein